MSDKDEMSSEIPEQVLTTFRAFEQAFNMRHRAAIAKVRPEGSARDFYVMCVIPFPGEPPVPLAIVPEGDVMQMLTTHAILIDRYGVPRLSSELN